MPQSVVAKADLSEVLCDVPSGFSQCEDYVHGFYSVVGQTEDLWKARFGSILYSLVFLVQCVKYSFLGASLVPLLHELLV